MIIFSEVRLLLPFHRILWNTDCHKILNENLLFTVREKTSVDPAGKNSENSISSKKTGDKEGGDKETGDNNQNAELITSTIEETECDWEYAHVIILQHKQKIALFIHQHYLNFNVKNDLNSLTRNYHQFFIL